MNVGDWFIAFVCLLKTIYLKFCISAPCRARTPTHPPQTYIYAIQISESPSHWIINKFLLQTNDEPNQRIETKSLVFLFILAVPLVCRFVTANDDNVDGIFVIKFEHGMSLVHQYRLIFAFQLHHRIWGALCRPPDMWWGRFVILFIGICGPWVGILCHNYLPNVRKCISNLFSHELNWTQFKFVSLHQHDRPMRQQ